MDSADLVTALHASPHQAVVAVTGGGSRAISDLLIRPGASATVLEAVVPYSAPALVEWLGHEPEQACSESTARAMAMAAFERARHLAGDTSPDLLIGIGATASLATTRPKRGDHRLHVAAQTATRTLCLTVVFEKGLRTRDEEEAFASHTILAVLADAAGLHTINPQKTPSGAVTTLVSSVPPSAWSELLLGERGAVYLAHGKPCDAPPDPPRLLFPGSFNPLHAGHLRLAEQAEVLTGHSAWFELSLKNVDKPSLDFLEVEQRMEPLSDHNVLLTGAPTFVEKANLVPGCTFAVGVDTLSRIAEVRYYHDRFEGREQALSRIAQLGCRFLVFGREQEGTFQSGESLPFPDSLRKLCDMVPERDFRCDVSSTQLREDASQEGSGS